MIVGVIGTGVMGKNHVRVYSEMKGVDEVCTFDISGEVIPGCTKYDNMSDLVCHVDAVSVCVPTEVHYSILNKIKSLGVAILVEKPLCATVYQAERINDKGGSIFGVGHIERFNPVVNEISKLVKNPVYIEFNRHNPTSIRAAHTSVIEDLMIHDIDIAQNVLYDTLQSITAIGSDDALGVLCKFGRVPIYLSASRKASKKVRRIYVEEEDITIEGDLMSQEVYIYHKPELYSFTNRRYFQEKISVNKVEPLRVELQTFLDCVNERKPFPVTVLQATENLRTCEVIRSQLHGTN
jgi:predicted dehydrogenase